jgi:hypothetical protein
MKETGRMQRENGTRSLPMRALMKEVVIDARDKDRREKGLFKR